MLKSTSHQTESTAAVKNIFIAQITHWNHRVKYKNTSFHPHVTAVIVSVFFDEILPIATAKSCVYQDILVAIRPKVFDTNVAIPSNDLKIPFVTAQTNSICSWDTLFN